MRFLTIGVGTALVLSAAHLAARPVSGDLAPARLPLAGSSGPSDAGFVPDTGQINLGYDPKLPSDSTAAPGADAGAGAGGGRDAGVDAAGAR